MAAQKLNFKDVPSVPGLKVADDVTSSGIRMHVLSTGPDTIHIVPADASNQLLGELTVVGPSITTVVLDWQWVVEAYHAAVKLGEQFFGGGEGGGGGCKPTATVVSTFKDGQLVSQSISTTCQ